MDDARFKNVLVDDGLWAREFDGYDPRFETCLPTGTYALSVADFYGRNMVDLMIAVDVAVG